MSSLKFLTISLVCLSLISIISCADFTSCPTEAKNGKLQKIQVTNCNEENTKCPFKTGHNVSMELTFDTNKDYDTAKIKIAGILTAIPVPFKINPDQVCNYGAKCPLKANVENTISLSFPIKATYPKIQLTVQVQLIGSNGDAIVCVRFPAQIVSS